MTTDKKKQLEKTEAAAQKLWAALLEFREEIIEANQVDWLINNTPFVRNLVNAMALLEGLILECREINKEISHDH